MTTIEKDLQDLNAKLKTLKLYQTSMQDEIARIEFKLQQLQIAVGTSPAATISTKTSTPISNVAAQQTENLLQPTQVQPTQTLTLPPSKEATTLENFIGTNLISKIGILITIIGVFIGARYAIDRNLVSPSMRIILSYAFAGALALVGLKLKARYNAFSAVLVGGSIAIIYFSTYLGHTLYNFIPQVVAFIIMLVTTVLAVAMAIWYNQKIIALIGQIAAYAIPILLSDGSGRVAVLFTYVSIINAGLMVLSFKKNWKIIYRIAFAITWSLYAGLLLTEDKIKLPWGWSLFFITICFATFYITYLSYKIFRKELYSILEVSVLLLNAIIYYFIGYVLIDRIFDNTNALTVFTLANALVHLAAGYIIHRLKLADDSVRLFLWGQALTFITIAIPVKLDGSWVTLLWSIEAGILIYTASRTQRKLYYQLCGVLLAVTIISLVQDWIPVYTYNRYSTKPFLNQTFLTSLVAAATFLFAAVKCRTGPLPFANVSRLRSIFTVWLPIVFFVLLYLGVFHEIHLFFDQLNQSAQHPTYRDNLGISMLNLYTLIYISIFLSINKNYLRDSGVVYFLFWAGLAALGLQLTSGLLALGELQNSPLRWVRYLNFSAIALLWWLAWENKKLNRLEKSENIVFSLAFNITLLTIISNEYIYWVRLSGSSSEYRLGLSIIFGAYALIILFRGLMLNITHLRIFAIVLFGLAIIKLFAYDLHSMSTVGKTIVLIILGVILLAASFLYNKYVKRNNSNDNNKTV